MDRLIFIAGQGHSGSTLLDMLLSSGGKAVSLGELISVMGKSNDKLYDQKCSCGAIARECPFWKQVFGEFGALGEEATLADKYRALIKVVDAQFGTDAQIIDSSKNLSSLKVIENFADVEIVPILMAKDVRSYVTSMLSKTLKRSGKTGVFEPEKLFLSWFFHNWKIDRYLTESNNYRPFRVVYEELVFSTDDTIARINQQLGGEYIDLEGSFNSHIISGNRMRHKIVQPNDIRYDYRWLAQSDWLRPYVLMPFVSRYNQRLYEILSEKESSNINILYKS